jgi:5-methylcytosine-specific restriction protein A
LQRYPLCTICESRGLVTPSTQVDHRWPLIDGGDDSEGNCWGLCDVCHRHKTSAEARRRALGLKDELPGLPPMKSPQALVIA